MTAKALRYLLSAYPDDTLVYIRGYEDGIDDADRLVPVLVQRDVYLNNRWSGDHEYVLDQDTADSEIAMAAEYGDPIPVYTRGLLLSVDTTKTTKETT